MQVLREFVPFRLARALCPLEAGVEVEGGEDGRVEHFLQVLLGQRRALDVLHSADALRQVPGVPLGDGDLVVARQFDEDLDVVAQVALRPDENERRLGTVSSNLRHPLFENVVKGRW